MTATLDALGDRRGRSPAAVVTTDGATWSWPDLFAQFAPTIRSYARSRGASSPEDVVQEVFAAAVERFPRFEGDSSGLRSFLFTLAYRRVADDHRVSHRRREQLVADHHPTADNLIDIEEAFTAGEDADEAIQALGILGDRERRVIEMRIFDETSPAEVAESLGLSNANVRVIQARALMKIRKYLESRSGALPSTTFVFAFLKALRHELPTDGALAEWIAVVQSDSTRDTVKVAASGAGSVVAVGAAISGGIAGSVLKVGLVVAIATASISAVAQVTDDDRAEPELPGLAVAPAPLAETEPIVLTGPPAVIDDPTPGIGIAPDVPNRPDLVPPTRHDTDSTPSQPESTDVPENDIAVEGEDVHGPDSGASQPSGGILDPVVDGVGSTVDTVVDTVVGTVHTVVDTVVDTVDKVVTTVDTVVDTVVDDVVKVVVDDVVEVVDETTKTVNETVNSVVDDVIDTSVDTIDTVVDDLLKKPLGGLLG